MPPSRFTFKRVGTMTWDVYDRATEAHYGLLWRTRHGYAAQTHLGRLLPESFTSRDTAAGILAVESRNEKR